MSPGFAARPASVFFNSVNRLNEFILFVETIAGCTADSNSVSKSASSSPAFFQAILINCFFATLISMSPLKESLIPIMLPAGTPWMSITANVEPLFIIASSSATVSLFQDLTFGIMQSPRLGEKDPL